MNDVDQSPENPMLTINPHKPALTVFRDSDRHVIDITRHRHIAYCPASLSDGSETGITVAVEDSQLMFDSKSLTLEQALRLIEAVAEGTYRLLAASRKGRSA